MMRLTTLALVLLLSLPTLADTLTQGMPFPSLRLTDQHDQAVDFDTDRMLIVFAPDRDSSEIVHPLMNRLEAEGMQQRGIHYIADISSMPGFVTSMFALPKMRDYPYRIALGRETEDTAMLPRREGQVSLLWVRDGMVEDIRFESDTASLDAVIETRDRPVFTPQSDPARSPVAGEPGTTPPAAAAPGR